ncbi:MAG: acyl-CoA dehydrogenase, partial [Burkholderiales bacterium]|nr:acyl-CoA dehydrogenase [Burkholderiales bacterium]
TLVGLAFLLKDPDGLLKGSGREGITCALLPHDHEGLEIGNRLFPLNQAFMNGTVRIKESFIPIDWVIGGQSMCGEGWRMLVECLSIGRAISLPTCATANSLMATVMTSAYSLVREQFKVPIASFEGVEEGLAKMAGLTYMMDAARRLTVAAVDAGVSPSVASAISKCHLTENGRTVMTWAMDIHAGRGVIMGPNNYLARAYEGIPVGITVEGANIMTRNLMIFGQGAMRCHPYIRTIYESLTTEGGYDRFDAAVTGHIGYFSQNLLRALVNGISGGLTARGYSSKYNQYYKQLSRLSSAYALVNDGALIILNGSLKFRERLSARLGDVMSYLYMASAVLKYCKLDGEARSDELYVKWALEHSLYQAQQALVDTLDNFPSKAFACAVKFMVFPYGKPLSPPSDKLEHELVKELMKDGDTRKAFKKYVPMDLNMQDVLGRMELAYQTVLSTTEIKAKIMSAVRSKQLPKANVSRNKAKALELGIISQVEFEQLNKADEYTSQVIQVDEFGPYELGPKNAHPNWSK